MEITKYSLFLDRFDVSAAIGIHDFERTARQRVAISIEVEIDVGRVPGRDDIGDAMDYDWVRDEIARLVDGRRFELQETLAQAIVEIAFRQDRITAVKVETAKLDVYPDVRSVGCRLEARRD